MGSAVAGKLASAGDRERATQYIEDAIRDYEAAGVPSIEAQQLLLKEFENAGQLTPELEQMVKMGPSSVGEISLDPGYKSSQLRALDELESIGSNGGMRLADEAALEKTLGQIRSENKGRREAITSNFRDRGVSGSGMELAAQLANAQDADSNSYLSGLDIAGRSQDRALQSIIQGGNLAGSLRGQEYNEKLNAAKAADEIEKFNTANQINMGQRNVASKNDAAKYNLSEKQRVSDANTNLLNQEQQYNRGLLQKKFDNEMAKSSGMANARTGAANNYNSAANSTQQMWGGIGQGLGQIGTQIALSEDQKKKKELANA